VQRSINEDVEETEGENPKDKGAGCIPLADRLDGRLVEFEGKRDDERPTPDCQLSSGESQMPTAAPIVSPTAEKTA